MHELSIALNIAECASEIATKHNATGIKNIRVEIGALAGIDSEALQFAWPEVLKRCGLFNAELIIEEVKASALCNKCGQTFSCSSVFELCPQCGAFDLRIHGGKELRIKNMELQIEQN
ncbi:MAG: hydrogenase maturation nickel metallochaperone HypA [Cyclobacteriaceae bacterium]|nr:hydrogenase maturation nickel metallochaperone HypA [Cyclobacteriaceae bacterium]